MYRLHSSRSRQAYSLFAGKVVAQDLQSKSTLPGWTYARPCSLLQYPSLEAQGAGTRLVHFISPNPHTSICCSQCSHLRTRGVDLGRVGSSRRTERGHRGWPDVHSGLLE
jgi:hypothetical protein